MRTLKKITLVCLILLLLTPSMRSSASAKGNLLINGDFEEELENHMIPGWPALLINTKYDRDVFITHERASSGNKSIKIKKDIQRDAKGIRSLPVPVEEGKTYQGTAQVWIEAGEAHILLEYLDENGGRLKTYIGKAMKEEGWQYLSVEGKAPSRASTLAPLGYTSITR